jgi:transcriptional regulator with XRE-family HTH domain
MIDAALLVKTREGKEWSQADLGRLAGCSQQLIASLESGDTRTTKFLPQIAGALGLEVGQLDPDWAAIAAPTPQTIPERQLMEPGRDFPIYAAAEGGPGEIIRSAEPVDWVPRPAPVARVKDAYGLHVIGESMFPEFEPGDVALVNPALPPVGNTTCIFYAEKEGEARATIKRLRRSNADKWLVQQWNPAKNFELSRREWAICHRVLGKYYRQ